MATVFATVSTPGPPGPAGPPGTSSIWIVAAGAPSNLQGNNGDMYLNNSTGDVYGPKASNVWGAIVANIKGSTGPAGATGAPGYSPQYIVQPSPPTAGQGNNGDMYINSATSDLYGPKTAGVWGPIVANLKGQTGAQGPPGVAYTPRGQWVSTTTYAQGDEVTDLGILYIGLQATNLNHVPASSATWWQPVAAGGIGQTPWLSNIDAAGLNLNNAGAIGIGSAAGAHAITIQSSSGTNFDISAVNSNTAAALGMVLQNDSTDQVQFGLGGSALTNVNWRRVAFLLTTRDIAFGTGASLTERMRITAAGNVGIGTGSPVTLLTIHGGTDKNCGVSAGIYTSGVAIASFNDAYTANAALELRGFPVVIGTQGSATPLPSGIFSGVYAMPEALVIQTDGATGSINSKGPLVLVNPDPTVGNAASILFATQGTDGSIHGNAQIAAVFTTARTTGYCPTDLAFNTGTTGGPAERMRITAGGNVGINSLSPGARLEVVGGGTAALRLRDAATGPLFLSSISSSSNNIQWWKDTTPSFAAGIGISSPSQGLVSNIVFSVFNGSAWADPMTITAAGNVGIGTALPDAPLVVRGSATAARGHINALDSTPFAAGVGGRIAFMGEYTAGSNVAFGIIAGYKATATSGDFTGGLIFQTLPGSGIFAEVMRMTSAGYVGINWATPTDWLMVRPASGQAGITIQNKTNGAGNESTLTVLHASAGFGWRARAIDLDGSFALDVQASSTWLNTALIVKTSTGRVGIAQASPGYSLDVTGDVNCTGVFRTNGTPISGGSGGITTQNSVAASRALGVNYGPNGAKPVFVTASIQTPSGQGINAYSDNTSAPGQIVASSSNGSASFTMNVSVSFWVLPGNYFRITCTSGGSIYTWTEWN